MEMPLPEYGKETAAPLKKFSAPKQSFDYTSPENSWLYDIKLTKAGNNVATLNELISPELMERFMKEVLDSKRTTIMLSGLHARHVYTCNQERVFKYIKAFCEAAHRHGLRVIEHHDVTLLWNTDAGFRRLAERIDEVNRSLDTQLPGLQLCPLNPKMMETYTEYLSHMYLFGGYSLRVIMGHDFWTRGTRGTKGTRGTILLKRQSKTDYSSLASSRVPLVPRVLNKCPLNAPKYYYRSEQ